MGNHEVYFDEDGRAIQTAVAIDRDKNSQFAVRWAVENLSLRNRRIILVHVNTQEQFDDVGTLAQTQAEMQRLFLPYRGYCARKGIRTKEVILTETDIAGALSEFVSSNSIINIVFGSSSRGAIARAFKYTDVPTTVARSTPDSCSVYAVGKGKAVKMKSASETISPVSVIRNAFLPNFRQGSWRSGFTDQSLLSDDSKNSSPLTSRSNTKEYTLSTPERPSFSITHSPQHSVGNIESQNIFPWESRHGSPNSSFDYASLGSSNHSSRENSRANSGEFRYMTPTKRNSGGKTSTLQRSSDHLNLRGRNFDLSQFSSLSSDRSEAHSLFSSVSYDSLDRPSTSNSSRCSTSTQAHDLEDELKRMKLDLMQMAELYNVACKEAVMARETLKDLVQWQSEEAIKLEEAKKAQEAACAVVEREKQKSKAAIELAQKAQRIAEFELDKRKHAEMKFRQEVEQKCKAMDALAQSVVQYRKYSIDEIESATKHFSSLNKIGEGGYGPVYKATVDHTSVAIKVLKSDIAEGRKQFQREVEVLSQMRHPNMVILLGACPEYGCLVYEYMAKGSLEDRLFCKDGTPPLPWRDRFRIASEIATALNFLHQTRPDPIVHRDLKPANILLDRNYVSKISDVGLSRLVPQSVADSLTQNQMTAAVGTFCYIDPEYQQTGTLGTKSDVYSLGILYLQMITAKPPMGLTYIVEQAIEMGRFDEVLDQTVDDWPVEETLSLAKLALKCCELRRRDRPDLDSIILPEVERLRDFGSMAETSG